MTAKTSTWLIFGVLFVNFFVYNAKAYDIDLHLSKEQCMLIKKERKEHINYSDHLILSEPLRTSRKSACFTPIENMYWLALIHIQKNLKLDLSWYDKKKQEYKDRAKKACAILGYGIDNFEEDAEQCEKKQYVSLITPLQAKYVQQKNDYIKNRNEKAEDLVASCLETFYKKLPSLPNSMSFPVAYYDKQIRSYPSWYIEDKLEDNIDWFSQKRGHGVLASHILSEALGNVCPNDMIWWLYLP